MKTSWTVDSCELYKSSIFLYFFLLSMEFLMSRWAIREVWWNTFWLWARRYITTWITFHCRQRSSCQAAPSNSWRPPTPAAARRPARVRRYQLAITWITCPSSLEPSLLVRDKLWETRECSIVMSCGREKKKKNIVSKILILFEFWLTIRNYMSW